MKHQPTNDRFEEFLRAAARGRNAPPPAPRDEMWAVIVEQRRARAHEAAVRGRWMRWAVGAAAVLAVGIGIGRVTVRSRAPVMTARAGESPAATYQAITGQHLERVEALLTIFRTEARAGRPDEQVSSAARGLLSTNRLLLDSPVAGDPRMKELLGELELVLAQIAQLSVERGVDPTDLIVHALEDNGVLLRLRSAIPAGPLGGSAQGAL